MSTYINNIIKMFNNIRYGIEGANFRDEHTRDKFLNIIDDIQPYFNVVTLSIINHDTLEFIHTLISEMDSVFREDPLNGIDFPLKHEDMFDVHLNEIKDSLSSIKGLSLYKELNKNFDNVLQQVQNKIRQQAKEQFGETTINNLDYEFSEEYKKRERQLKNNENIFGALLILAFLSFCLMVMQFEPNISFLDFLLKRFLVFMPLLWFLLYLSIKLKEDRVILQFYLHKKLLQNHI